MSLPGQESAAPILEARRLVRRFGDRTAVSGVSFAVHAGESVGFLGPNGAGKTTTFNLLTGLLRPDSGEVLVGDAPIRSDTDPVKRRLGLVPQDLALYEELDALIALSTFAFSFAVAIGAFGVRIHGSVLGFLAVILSLCVFSAALALALASVGRTPKATRGLAIPVVLILLMLGGAWIPSFIFPPWVRTVSRCVPTGWAIDALDAMTWRGLDLSAVYGPVAGLWAVTAALAFVAWRNFRWEAA